MRSGTVDKITLDGQIVFFADSRDMGFIGDGTVDLVMTSPPYWNLKNYGHDGQIGNGDYETYLQQLNGVWDECYRVTTPEALFVLNVGNRGNYPLV